MKIWLQNLKFLHNSRNNKDQKPQKRVYSFKATNNKMTQFQANCEKKIFDRFWDLAKNRENLLNFKFKISLGRG